MAHPLDRPLTNQKKRFIDRANRLRGVLVGSYSQVEFLLGHLWVSMEPFDIQRGNFPYRAETRLKEARRMFEIAGSPLFPYRDRALGILSELELHERNRHFMAHGYMDLKETKTGDPDVHVRCYRPKPDDPNEEEIRWTLNQMEAEAKKATDVCGRWMRLHYDIHAQLGWVAGV
jgi:hypothetical protein